jgi:beta-lactamase regulating signal transducer with metallopeptidase domain
MMTELSDIFQALVVLALVLSAPMVLVLLLRKPVRALLGSIACYRLWLLSLLWLLAYALGGQLQPWRQVLRSHTDVSAPTDVGNFQLLLNDWVWQPLDTIGNNAAGGTSVSFNGWGLAALLWLAGSAAIIAWQLYKFRRFSQRVQATAWPITPADLPAAEVNAMFGNAVPALVLPSMNSAALFGIRKPVLLLPASFGEHYDADQQHIILAHEAVHLRRHDNAWNLAAGLLVVLGWPNPLFWLAWRCYRFDQELSCDALALASCTHTQQKCYARTLLAAASTSLALDPQPALSAWDNLNDLKERTLMIAQHLKNKVSPLVMQSCLSVIAVGGAMVMVLLAGSFSPVTVAAEPTREENIIDPQAGGILRDAIKLENSKNDSAARAKLDALNLSRLSPDEHSHVEQMYFNLDVRGKNYAGARQHMENAIASGGMTAEKLSSARYQLAQLWLQEEKWAEAAEALEEWLANETDPKGRYLLPACCRILQT